ncbi:MAG: nitrogen fixation protein NifQ [Burkholderiales bacterium]|nr:nitrogen fixation protein NifQ [Burkholderiales bacterium]
MLYAPRDGRLSPDRAAGPAEIDPGDWLGGAFAFVIGTRCNPDTPPFVPGLGMGAEDFSHLLAARFPGFSPPAAWRVLQQKPIETKGPLQEFDDLLQLFFEHMAADDRKNREVAHLLASACMGSDHLWQDLGLPSRSALSELMSQYFPGLAEKNRADMKWKKFFYRALCEREGIRICKSPSCASCLDHQNCFGPEQ